MNDTPLRERLFARIGEGGPITFHDYMQACLYDPDFGYYTSRNARIGREGDFYTSSDIHQAFGRILAREICRMWEVLGRPAGFTAAEAGAGSGLLAKDVLDGIRDYSPALYETLTYRLIEIGPQLRATQAERLTEHAAKTAWSDPAELSGGSLRFTGCLFSNELIDAFPVHLVQMTSEGLKEVFVTVEGDDFAEMLGEPSTPELEAYLARLGVTLFQGQRAEINLAAPAWLASVADSLERGFVITIDYGYTATDLFSPMRRTGTLLCYYRHTVEENPYKRPGEQDITTHIDFTTLIMTGEAHGLSTCFFGEQYRYLLAAGVMEELMAMEARAATEEERIKNRLAMKKLILPDGGMGDTFKVLVQGKGVEKPDLLCLRDWRRGFP